MPMCSSKNKVRVWHHSITTNSRPPDEWQLVSVVLVKPVASARARGNRHAGAGMATKEFHKGQQNGFSGLVIGGENGKCTLDE
jgi:hypothetical protein